MNPSSRIYRETTEDGEMLIDLDLYKAMTGREFHGQKIPVYTNDDKYKVADTTDDKYDAAEPTDDRETFLNMDADKSITGHESTSHKIPVHTNDDKYHAAERTVEGTEITTLQQELNFLKNLHATQETIHQSKIVSLQASLATALSKINVLEHNVIAPLQVTVSTLEEENKILRWQHDHMLAAIEGNDDAADDEIPKAKKEETQVKGKGGVKVFHFGLLVIFLVLVAAFAASQSGYNHAGAVFALGEAAAAAGRIVERMVEAVDGSWGTVGCQAVDGRRR